MEWKELKKSILKKKIMLNFIIENYSWKDKLFKYIHIILATTTPLLSVIVTANANSDNTSGGSNVTIIILSIIVAIMVKLKEYTAFDKIRDLAKEQTIKYRQLLEKVELNSELGLNIAEYIKEYNNIELSDPELNTSERKKFKRVCKDKGIPYDEDMAALEKLLIIPDKESLNTITLPTSTSTSTTTSVPVVSMNTVEVKKKYRDSLKNMNTTAELRWTIDRLSILESNINHQ